MSDDRHSLLSEQLASSEHKPSVFISASATGFIDMGSEVITEILHPVMVFTRSLCEWENQQQRRTRESEWLTSELELF